MKFFDIPATVENVLAAFEENVLGRNPDIMAFVSLLNSFDSSVSIALDASWGAGKTFFVKQTKLVLDCFNPNIKVIDTSASDRVKKVVKTLSKTEPELQPFVTVYYDAWINDNDADPILSLVYSILKCADSDFSFTDGQDILSAVTNIADALSGMPITTVLSSLKGKDLLESIRNKKAFDTLVTEFLSSLLPERGERLVVFVDELDRCNPDYAVKFLERIKHYFCDERITFVFSVNMGELQHSIQHHYGNNFDACRYLDRFFDLRLDLPPANYNKYFDTIGLNHDRYFYDQVCQAVVNTYNFSLRETAKFFRLAKTAAYESARSVGYSFDRANDLFLQYILPVMIGGKLNNHAKYTAFINGFDGSMLFDFHEKNIELVNRICSRYIPEDANRNPVVTSLEFIEQFYDAVFVEQYTNKHIVELYEMDIYKEHRSRFIRISNALSGLADYEI